MLVVKLIDFKPQTASKTPFRELSPAISNLLKFPFSPEKREKTVNVSFRFLTDISDSGKKLNHRESSIQKRHD